MSTTPTALAPPANTEQTGRELVDPGWQQRREDAVGLVCAAVMLATVCGLLINWLGFVGVVLAAGLYLGCLRWVWRWHVGGEPS